jgi:hypothetical protein
VSNVSEKQIAFARRMTARQWAVLRGLAEASFHLSVTEWADLELYALVKNDLAACFAPAPGLYALWGWGATDAGRAVVKRKATGGL